ncbi:MAG: hypothetical protein GF344_02235 [Chitinivibrionales bacterium]|nr:hypothetical protein [Chitinivibrionales bacterium]MBD3355913.1 hypothetical protein [Chitinivibrionales bacterium]
MIGKVLLLPFALVKGVVELGFGIVAFLGRGIGGILKFVFNHVFGTVLGATVGFLLGRRHVGIKLFPGHRGRKKA